MIILDSQTNPQPDIQETVTQVTNTTMNFLFYFLALVLELTSNVVFIEHI